MKKRANTTVKILVHLLFLCASALGRGQSFNCDAITFTLQNTGGCCYRLTANNTTPDNCFQQVQLVLDPAIFTNFAPLPGWQWSQADPNYITVRPSVGFIPFGTSNIATFCVAGGPNTTLNISWDNLCTMESCVLIGGLPVNACAPNGKIRGVKYVDVGCRGEFFNGQPTLPNWPVELFDGSGNLLRAVSTGANGIYEFAGLLPGNYLVREGSQTGWQPGNPASGAADVTVPDVNATVTQDFGNCPTTCACDSIYLNVSQLEGESDTSTYFLTVLNSGLYCFSFIDIEVGGGQILDWSTLLPGWTVVQQSANILQLSPPGPLLPGGGSEPLRFRVRGAGDHAITATTYWGDGFNDVACPRSFVYPSPPVPIIRSCCPTGTSPGPELVQDGGFSNFNPSNPTQFFTSNYSFLVPGSPAVIGRYSVMNSGQTSQSNGAWSCVGITGNPADKFLVIDGSIGGPLSNNVGWRQSVNVQSGTDYAFCAYVNNLVVPTRNLADPVPQLWVNNQLVASLPSNTLPENPNRWELLSGTWNSGTNSGPVNIEIRLGTLANIGNDLAVDGISFRSCAALPCGVSISASGGAPCGSGTLTAVPTGQGPFSYQWCNGQSTQSITWQNIPCGTVCTVTVTCANGSTSSASYTASDNVPPQIACPKNITVQGFVDAQGNCRTNVSGLTPTASDNCNLTSVVHYLNGNGPIFSGDASGTLFNQGTTTVAYVATDWCQNTASCSFAVTVECHDCFCPVPPNMQGPELVLGGQFNNIGGAASSAYTNNCVNQTEGQYCITANPQSINPGFFPCPDVDGGNSGMMVVNGATSVQNVWCSGTLAVTPGTDYIFSYWLASLTAANPPQLQLTINGTDYGSLAQASAGPCAWRWACVRWNSGTATSVSICIKNYSTQAQGNDFALDGISFRSCMPIVCTADIATPTPSGCGKFNFQGFGNGVPPITYSWNFGDPNSGAANSSTLQNPMHPFSAQGQYTVVLTITDGTGCTATYSVTVSVPPLPSVTAAANPNMVCVGQSLTLTATPGLGSGYTYSWSGPVSGTSNPLVFTPSAAGTYTATVTAMLNGCTANATASYTVKPSPSANAGADQTICQWQTAMLVATGGGTYAWSPNGSASNPYTTPPIGGPASYTVTVTDSNGCTATDQVLITIKDCSCTSADRFVLNDAFNNGNPCTFQDEDINQASNWGGIWPTQQYSTGDFWGQAAGCNPATVGLANATPTTQGQYAGFWCKPHSNVVWREGIKGTLSQAIKPNSGSYKVEMKIACLLPPPSPSVNGTARLSVYGLAGSSVSVIPTPPLTATTPSNTALFNGPAGGYYLGQYQLNTGNCTANFTTFSFVFNSVGLPNTIDNFYLTRDDGTGGNTYVAVDDICIEPVLDPATCECGQLEFAVLGRPFDWSSNISPGVPAISVPCPIANVNYYLYGRLRCTPDQCGDNAYSWKLDRPGILPDVTGNGVLTYPWFAAVINPADCSQSGNYSLTLSRQCGTNTCSKVFNFKLDACPCPCDSLKKDVGAGFSMSSVLLPQPNCSKKLRPLRLCPNDMVTWTVSNLGTFTSVGNAPVTVNFPIPGTYFICMIVKRTEPNGTVCYWEFCRKVIIKCGIEPVTSFCGVNKLRNGSFNEGLTFGLLNEFGSASDWELAPNPGDGRVVVDTSNGALDDGHMVLIGGKDNFAGILQEVHLEKDSAMVVNFEMDNYLGIEAPSGTQIEVRLQDAPFSYPGMKKQILTVQKTDTSGWHRKEVVIDAEVDTSLHYLVVCLQNDDPARHSIVGLDNIEICTADRGPSPVDCAAITITAGNDGMIHFTGLNAPIVKILAYDGFAQLIMINEVFNPGPGTYSSIDFSGQRIHGTVEMRDEDDNLICDRFFAFDVPVGTIEKSDPLSVRIYPNPNSGTFTVQLPQPARNGTSFKILGIAGQNLLEQPAETGSERQTIRAEHLPPGMYFLQVIAEEKVWGSVKFVRQ